MLLTLALVLSAGRGVEQRSAAGAAHRRSNLPRASHLPKPVYLPSMKTEVQVAEPPPSATVREAGWNLQADALSTELDNLDVGKDANDVSGAREIPPRPSPWGEIPRSSVSEVMEAPRRSPTIPPRQPWVDMNSGNFLGQYLPESVISSHCGDARLQKPNMGTIESAGRHPSGPPHGGMGNSRDFYAAKTENRYYRSHDREREVSRPELHETSHEYKRQAEIARLEEMQRRSRGGNYRRQASHRNDWNEEEEDNTCNNADTNSNKNTGNSARDSVREQDQRLDAGLEANANVGLPGRERGRERESSKNRGSITLLRREEKQKDQQEANPMPPQDQSPVSGKLGIGKDGSGGVEDASVADGRRRQPRGGRHSSAGRGNSNNHSHNRNHRNTQHRNKTNQANIPVHGDQQDQQDRREGREAELEQEKGPVQSMGGDTSSNHRGTHSRRRGPRNKNYNNNNNNNPSQPAESGPPVS